MEPDDRSAPRRAESAGRGGDDLAQVDRLLRDRFGIGPDHLTAVLDLFAIAVVNGAWRNGPVDDWHAQGRLSQSDMLRVNSHTTYRTRQLLARWRLQVGLRATARVTELDGVPLAQVRWLAARLGAWLADPRRRLPTGHTIESLAGDRLDELRQHADAVLGGFVLQADRRGLRYALWRAASQAGLACPHWWGAPRWPEQVGEFLRLLDDPDHRHWRTGGELTAPPPTAPDRVRLRRTLSRCPWELDAETADWVVRAGLGHVHYLLP